MKNDQQPVLDQNAAEKKSLDHSFRYSWRKMETAAQDRAG